MKKAPLYLSISDDFRSRIMNGELKPGDKLPTQRELAQQYNTTLMTIRQALEVLTSESLIQAVHGVGTFVANTGLVGREFKLLGFSQEMNKLSIQIETIVLSKLFDEKNEKAAETLKLTSSSRFCVLERCRYFAGLPIIYQKSYIAPGYKSIIEDYSQKDSLYDLFNRVSGQTIKTWKEILKPVILDKKQAEILQGNEGDCAFLAIRCSYSSQNLPVIYDEAILSNDRVSVITERMGQNTTVAYQIYNQVTTDPLSYLQTFVD